MVKPSSSASDAAVAPPAAAEAEAAAASDASVPARVFAMMTAAASGSRHTHKTRCTEGRARTQSQMRDGPEINGSKL